MFPSYGRSSTGGSGYVAVNLQESSYQQEDGNHLRASLEESLVPTPQLNSEVLSAVTTRPMLDIVAPATLPEGYEFTVQVGHQTIPVQVPVGGIERGQTFSVPFPDLATTKVSGMATGAAMVAIPVGHWRDQWYECFSHGLCHPHLWTSCMCTFLATGQVIRRLGLDARGSITNKPAEKATAFPLILTAVIVYFVVHIILAIVAVALDPNSGHEDEPDYMKLPKPKSYYWVMTIYNIWNWTYWIVTTIILMKTRQTVRQMYAIPAAEFEDCFFSVFCHCCVAAQLLRHTTDYNVYPSHCLSDTGLPKHVPSIV